MKEFLKRYRNDVALIGAIVLLSLLTAFLPALFRNNGAVVEISQDGRVLETLDLSVDTEITVTDGNGGMNRVVVRSGRVFVEDADCRDRICIKRGKIRKVGETIVCLPHKLVLTVRKGE